MAGEVSIIPGYTLRDGEAASNAKINKMIAEAVLRVVAGSITSRELANGTITADKLSADIAAQLGVQDGSITTAKIVDKAVTNAKLDDMPALSVKARASNSVGAPGDLQASADDQVLMRRAGALLFGSLSAAQLAAGMAVVSNVAGVKLYFGAGTLNILSTLYWSAGQTITFPAGFTAVDSYVAFAGIIDADGASLPGDTQYTAYAKRTATTGMTIFGHRTNNPAATVALGYAWVAIGT